MLGYVQSKSPGTWQNTIEPSPELNTAQFTWKIKDNTEQVCKLLSDFLARSVLSSDQNLTTLVGHRLMQIPSVQKSVIMISPHT